MAYQEPYTKYPNRYNDVIKPLLSDTQRDICDVVIRMTWGWHKESAEIANSVFVRKTNKSRQGIIKSKKQLEEKGLLIVLEKGGGSKTNEYMLDLWYDNPDKSVKVAMLRQEEELLEIENPLPEEDPHELLETEVIDKSEPEKEEELLYEEESADVSDNGQSEPEDNQEPEAEISDTGSAETLSSTEDSEPPTSKLSLPPHKEDLSSNTLSKRKQTVDSEDEKAERKEATAAVCSLFRSWRTELEQKDYAFVGWSLKTYGIEAVQQKMEIMRLQRSRGVSFSNPLGWLRSALSRDYGFCRWDSEVLKAKERAKRETERSRCEQAQREREIGETEELREKAKEIKGQLTMKDREDLRRRAIEQISDMGVVSNWINEPLIESVENGILRGGMVD